MTNLRVGQYTIGHDHPTFFIAEAGANWRISRDMKKNFRHAVRLIDIAVKARAESVKFQLYRANKLYTKNAGTADYIGKKKSIYDIIQEMELPYPWLRKLKRYCDRKRIMFLCTPFDERSVDELEKIGVAAYKIASYSVTHYPLLKYIAKKRKPIFISTGASDIKTVDRAVRLIRAQGNERIALLQCTAKYPAPLSALNLRVIPMLQERYGVPIGLSDHSRDPHIGPMGAVALGARVIEKHYTTDNALPGPDHGFAILADELVDLVANVRKLEAALGDERKNVTVDEQELHKFTEYRIFAIKDIAAGKPLEGSVDVLRSGKVVTGLFADAWDTVVTKRAKKRIPRHTPITKDLIV